MTFPSSDPSKIARLLLQLPAERSSSSLASRNKSQVVVLLDGKSFPAMKKLPMPENLGRSGRLKDLDVTRIHFLFSVFLLLLPHQSPPPNPHNNNTTTTISAEIAGTQAQDFEQFPTNTQAQGSSLRRPQQRHLGDIHTTTTPPHLPGIKIQIGDPTAPAHLAGEVEAERRNKRERKERE